MVGEYSEHPCPVCYAQQVMSGNWLGLGAAEERFLKMGLAMPQSPSDIAGQDLRNADFPDDPREGLTFIDCNMSGAPYQEMLFLNCKFVRCDFSNTELLTSDFPGSIFVDCDFTGSDVTGPEMIRGAVGNF